MNISNFAFKPGYNTHFKSIRCNDYLDDIESPYQEDLIPEYDCNDYDDADISESSFRENEQWDRKKDKWCAADRFYSNDDIPLAQDRAYFKLPNELKNISGRYVEYSDFISYPENDYEQPRETVYTADCAHKNKHESIQERLNQGFRREDITKIYHSSLVKINDNKIMNFDLADLGFNLIKSGKSIEDTTKTMDGSKCISFYDDSRRFNKNLFDFLVEFPDDRDVVVEKHPYYERFNRDIAKVYKDLRKIFDDKNDAKNIIECCKFKTPNSENRIDEELLGLCLTTIDEGKPVNIVTNAITQAKLEKKNNTFMFDKELFEFLVDFPGSRRYIVDIKGGNEYTRKDMFRAYPVIKNLCQDNKTKIKKVIELCETGPVGNKRIDQDCLNVFEEEFNTGKSMEDIVEDIEYSKLERTSTSVFNKDFYEFLKEYPDGRNAVIDKSYRNETLRRDKMAAYPELAKICDNPSDIESILNSCNVKKNEEKIDRYLLNFAKCLLQKDNWWRREHSEMLDSVKVRTPRNYTLIDTEKIDKAMDMIQNQKCSTDEVYAYLIPPKTN